MSVLLEHSAAATAALQPGGGRPGLSQSAPQMATPGAAKNAMTCTEIGSRIDNGRPLRPKQQTESLCWRQHHHHLASLETGIHLELGDLFRIAFEAIEQTDAKLLVRHFATAE